ncbi:hypothetical protein HYY69_03775 [Candidatus Woesearchaeota archaeon]|nr:hypothetical protein [Candidatus Woesearchaeota archaeon]
MIDALISPRVKQIIDEVNRRKSDPDVLRRRLCEASLNGSYQPTSANNDDPTAIYPTCALARQSLEHIIYPLSFYRIIRESALHKMMAGSADVLRVIPDEVKQELQREAPTLVDKIFDYLQHTPQTRGEMTEDLFVDTARVVINGHLGENKAGILKTVADNLMPGRTYTPFGEVMLAIYLLEQALDQKVLSEYFTIPNHFLADANTLPKGKPHKLVYYGTLPQPGKNEIRVYASEGTPADSTLLQVLPQLAVLPIDQQPVLVQTWVMKGDSYRKLVSGERQPTQHNDCYVLHINPPLMLTDNK